MKTLGTIQGCVIIVRGDGVVQFTAKAAIDADGSDNRHGDPDWQRETSLSQHGKPVDAESVPYIVVPPLIIRGVPGVILGAASRITNMLTGQSCLTVVADVGPKAKLGELSCEAARRIGLDGNPRHGGTDEKVIRYEIWPGTAAVVDGQRYTLKPSV